MNIKKFFLVLPALLMPYVAICALVIIFFSAKNPVANYIMESVFKSNALLLIFAMVIYVTFSIILSLICFFVSITKKWDALSLAKTAMIIKLIQIPAYIFIFILSLAMLITVFTLPFAIVLFFLNYLTLLSTGLLNISAMVVAARNSELTFKESFLTAILQFVFCADVVASILFFIKLKKKKQNGFAVVLNGEFAGKKFSAENLFSLPICGIMGLAKKPSSGRKVAREA